MKKESQNDLFKRPKNAFFVVNASVVSLFFLMALSLTACSPSCQPESQRRSGNNLIIPSEEKSELAVKKNAEAQILPHKHNEKPNDEFREKVLITIDDENDIKVFNTVLSKLDQQNLTICSVIGKLFAIDDECLASALSMYPDPSQQELFSTTYSSFIKQEYGKYSNSINLSMDEIRFLSVAYGFNQRVKSFCGSF